MNKPVIAADGQPVVIGDKFHHPDRRNEQYMVSDMDNLFVYMNPLSTPEISFYGPPTVVKSWKFALKGWVRINV